jgi:hypothetical protein
MSDGMAFPARFLFDPVVIRAVGAALSIVFFMGAWPKLRDSGTFRAAVDSYGLLPEPLVPIAARGLPLFELAAGLLLLFPETYGRGAELAGALLLLVTAAVVVNLVRGRTDLDCGCGGSSGQPLSWGLVARNAVLFTLTILAGQPGAERAIVWADYLTAGGAVLALVGLYVSVNQLMSNMPAAVMARK